MSLENHIAKLEERHSALDTQLGSVMTAHRAARDEEIKEMKLRKLQLKDEIERLRVNLQ